MTRRTGATVLSKTLRQRRLRLVGHALRMASPSHLTILLRFLQPGLRRRRGQARTLTLHQNIIDDISAINQNMKSITSATSPYINRIVATLSTNWAFNIYISRVRWVWLAGEAFHMWKYVYGVRNSKYWNRPSVSVFNLWMRVLSSINQSVLLEKSPFNKTHSRSLIGWSGMLKIIATGSTLLLFRMFHCNCSYVD